MAPNPRCTRRVHIRDGTRGSGRGATQLPVPLLEFFNLEDVVWHLAVGLAVYGKRGLAGRRIREAEDPARRGVVPVFHVAHAMLALNGKILLVERCENLGSDLIRRHEVSGFRIIEDDVDVDELAELTDGMTGADFKEALRRIQLAKAMSEIRGRPSTPITQNDLKRAVAELRHATSRLSRR